MRLKYYKVKETGEILSSNEIAEVRGVKTEDGYIVETESEVYIYRLYENVIAVEAVKADDFIFGYNKLYKDLDNCIAAAKEYKKELTSVEVVNKVK